MEVLELDFADTADEGDDILFDLDLVLVLGIDLPDEREAEPPVVVVLVTGVAPLMVLFAFLFGFEEFEIDKAGVVDPPPLSFTLSLLDDIAWPLTAAVEGTSTAAGWQLLSNLCVYVCVCVCECE